MNEEYKFTANTYQKITECPASVGPKARNKPKPYLKRWIDLNEAIGDWLGKKNIFRKFRFYSNENS